MEWGLRITSRQTAVEKEIANELGKSKCKSLALFQNWAIVNTNFTSLKSLGQDGGNICKLIPKSKPTYQKIRVKDFRKFCNVPRFRG